MVKVLKVGGLMYHGDFHFTSGSDRIVWYHDDMTTGSTCKNEADFTADFINMWDCKIFHAHTWAL